jgi:hypothetical protein
MSAFSTRRLFGRTVLVAVIAAMDSAPGPARGGGAGFSIRDRFEFSVSGYNPNRGGGGSGTSEVRAKIRLGDFGGRKSVGGYPRYAYNRRTGSRPRAR